MKKKFIVGTLLAASLLGCGTFTSCKDNNEDFQIEVTQEFTSLKSTIEKLQSQLALLAGCPEKCQEKIDALKLLMEQKDQELEGKLRDLNDALAGKADQSTVDGLTTTVNKLKSDVENLQNELRDLSNKIESLCLLKSTFESFQNDVNGKLGGILDRLDALEGKEGCTCPSVDELKKLLEDTFVLRSEIEGLFGPDGTLAGLQNQINAINATLATLPGFEDLKKIEDKIEALRTEFGSEINGINESIGGINTTILTIQAEIADLATIRQDIKDLKAAVAKIAVLEGEITRLENLINANKTELDGKINGLDTKISGLDTKLQNEIADVYSKIATEISGVKTEIKAIDDKLTLVQGQVNTNTTNIATNTANINALLTSVGELEKWFEGIGISVKEFQDYVKQGKFVKDNHDALEALVKLINDGTIKGEALKALNEVYKNLSGINDMYTTIFEGAQAPEEGWWKYDEVIKAIKANSAAIKQLQEDQEKILGRLNDMVTSLVLQAANNPVFGGFNTPFGINSMVLMTQYGNLTTSLEEFPISGVGAECNGNDNIDWSVVTNPYKLTSQVLVDTDEKGDAKLGDFWFTVNPGTVNTLDMNGFALVNSVEETNGVKLSNITKDDETVLTFGVTSRAAGNGNGLYKANVTIDPMELYKIKVNIQDGLAQTLKNAVKNHTASDMAAMVRAVYQQLHNICQANALRYTYEAYTSKNADGTWNKSAQKVYSNYGVAATAYKPLSFATLKGTSIDRRVPTFSPIEISKDRVNLDLGNFTINSSNFNLNLKFGEPTFDKFGELIVHTTVTLYDKNGDPVTGEVDIKITDQANDILKEVQDAIHKWLNEGGTLDYRIDKAVWQALFNGTSDANPKYPYDPSLPKGVIVDLKEQFEDMTGKIQDKLYDLVDEINKDYLGKVNSLISKYNTVAERINNFLADPNHYLQATMLYRKAGKFALNGKHMPDVELPFGILSTNPKQPTQFRGDGEAIALWATTYNFEVLCPTFKKVVAVTSVKDATGAERNDLKAAANKNLCQILDGDRTRVALDITGAKNGVFTYEIAYQALDYSGFTSTVKCYIQVVR